AKEVFVRESDVHGGGAALGHGLPWRIGVVVSVYLAQQVGVLIKCLLRSERFERIAEAAIFVTLIQAVVQAGDIEAGLEPRFFGLFVESFFVLGEGVGPLAV